MKEIKGCLSTKPSLGRSDEAGKSKMTNTEKTRLENVGDKLTVILVVLFIHVHFCKEKNVKIRRRTTGYWKLLFNAILFAYQPFYQLISIGLNRTNFEERCSIFCSKQSRWKCRDFTLTGNKITLPSFHQKAGAVRKRDASHILFSQVAPSSGRDGSDNSRTFALGLVWSCIG